MSIPTDRGFALIRINADGSQQVEIYSQRPSAGATPFAMYSRVDRVIARPVAGFVDQDGGKVSRQPVEVVWSESDAAVYIIDEAPISLLG